MLYEYSMKTWIRDKVMLDWNVLDNGIDSKLESWSKTDFISNKHKAQGFPLQSNQI